MIRRSGFGRGALWRTSSHPMTSVEYFPSDARRRCGFCSTRSGRPTNPSEKSTQTTHSVSTFRRLIPRNVRKIKVTDKILCLCAYCVRVQFIMEALGNLGRLSGIKGLPTMLKHLIYQEEPYGILQPSATIQVKQWTKQEKKPVLITTQRTVQECIDDLRESVPKLRDHLERHWAQVQAEENIRKNLKSGEIAIHLNFSANFTIRNNFEFKASTGVAPRFLFILLSCIHQIEGTRPTSSSRTTYRTTTRMFKVYPMHQGMEHRTYNWYPVHFVFGASVRQFVPHALGLSSIGYLYAHDATKI